MERGIEGDGCVWEGEIRVMRVCVGMVVNDGGDEGVTEPVLVCCIGVGDEGV